MWCKCKYIKPRTCNSFFWHNYGSELHYCQDIIKATSPHDCENMSIRKIKFSSFNRFLYKYQFEFSFEINQINQFTQTKSQGKKWSFLQYLFFYFQFLAQVKPLKQSLILKLLYFIFVCLVFSLPVQDAKAENRIAADCPPILIACLVYCPYGFAYDSNGCKIPCKCATTPLLGK